MSWERDLNNGKNNKRAERRQQKERKDREIYSEDDEAETLGDHIKHGQKTRQELKMELNQEEDLDGF